jgi:DNA-binding NtrC family response regulator
MKSNILLVAQGASSSNSVIANAAVEAGRGLRHASSSHDYFEILADGLDNIDVVIIDVDPGIHSLSVLEALSYRKTAPPIIVVTGFEEMDMAPMAYRHGATACIGKPFTALELAALIHDVCVPAWRRRGGSCDRWGHPSSGSRRDLWRMGHSYERLHCMSV